MDSKQRFSSNRRIEVLLYNPIRSSYSNKCPNNSPGSSLLGENKTRNLSFRGTDMRSKQSRNISSKVRSVDFKKEKGIDVNTHLNRQHNNFKVPTKNEGGDKKPEANMFEHRNT